MSSLGFFTSGCGAAVLIEITIDDMSWMSALTTCTVYIKFKSHLHFRPFHSDLFYLSCFLTKAKCNLTVPVPVLSCEKNNEMAGVWRKIDVFI